MRKTSCVRTPKFTYDDYTKMVKSYYETNTKKGIGNIDVPFRSEWAIDKKSGEFIFNMVKELIPNQTLEVGLAQGASTLHFLAALKFIQQGRHTAMDPLQGGFSDVGLAEMSRLGIDNRLRFFRERSDIILPILHQKEESFQVCLIDGDHRFDTVFTDFYFIDKVLEIGGLIIFGEGWAEPRENVISFIKNNLKNYEFQKDTPSRFHVIKKMDIDRLELARCLIYPPTSFFFDNVFPQGSTSLF